ncbi:MAG: 23S rRNA (adenine(2503)-C(2))-methyltransferase RlmN [Acidobacteriota bacterium]|nr:23S rRNA (adenine(2503)-C(2))-methyltransferase RlmN [Acidobacteriota bacterium]
MPRIFNSSDPSGSTPPGDSAPAGGEPRPPSGDTPDAPPATTPSAPNPSDSPEASAGSRDPKPPSPEASEKGLAPDLLGLPLKELQEILAPVVDRPFRAKQIFHALHQRGVSEVGEMTDLSKELRRKLEDRFRIGVPKVVEAHTSADETTKYLFELTDGAVIEAVDIPDGERRTLCISSQAGCALACRFCVTGYWGGGRNLTAGEIVGQVQAIRQRIGELPAGLNLVFMGMGEPLLNPDNVRDAIHLLAERISWRRMTLSTVGILPALEEMARWPKRPNLAVSLHAPDDELRSRLMPVNQKYPLADLMALLHRWPLEKGRKITFEYVLIRDVNDSLPTADALASLVQGLPAKVNLIPVNHDPVLGERMQPPAPETTERFQQRLKSHGVVTTVRRQRGDEVSGACGQLRASHRPARGFRTPVQL